MIYISFIFVFANGYKKSPSGFYREGLVDENISVHPPR